MEFRTGEGPERYAALVAGAQRALVGLDFDGVLSPIVADPASAVIHPRGPEVLAALVPLVRAVAVVTGRPAHQAVELGGLDRVADAVRGQGRLLVLGQYGAERWTAEAREVVSSEPPEGLAGMRVELPALLAAHDAADAHVEDKQIAVAVHTRRLADPHAAYARLLPALTEAATRHGLVVEPGRMVLEIRAPGSDKGTVLRRLHADLGAGAVLFAGDDLGDVAAFEAVADLRAAGHPGLLVCADSTEQQALVGPADLVVDGPAGVLDLLTVLTGDLRAR